MDLITGISGFIGSNLAEYLLMRNEHFVGIDNNIVMKRVENISKSVMDIVNGDIKHMDYYKAYFEDAKTIYHLAAACDINKSLNETTWDLTENVVGTHSVLEVMRKYDIPNIVFTSTSVVYGEDAPRPTSENYTNYSPISQYAASKAAAEIFIKTYANIYGLKATVFRFANVVGKNEHRGVICDFIKKLKENPNELEILGNGKQVKSYFHVSDCVNAIVEIPKKNKKNFNVYNIATYDQVNVDCVADIVCKKLGLEPKITYTGGDRGWIGDVPIVILSIKKALSTGWKPMFDCRMSIKRTVEELCGD